MYAAAARTFPVIISLKSQSSNSLFECCTSLRFLQQLHTKIILCGLHLSSFFCSKLAKFYFDFGQPQYAQQAFDQIPTKNLRSWNTMLSGYLKAKLFSQVLHIYQLFRAENQSLSSYSVVFGIRACIKLSLKEGRSIHSDAIKFGLETSTYVSPSLINMYQELGSLSDAEKVFKQAPVMIPNVWGLMMKGYSRASMDLQVLESFERMKELGVKLDTCAAVCLARAYSNFAAAKQGCAIHGLCIKSSSMGSNVFLQTSLLDMYVKSGFTDYANKLFGEMPCKDIVSWSTVVGGLAQCGRAYESLRVFEQMLANSIVPNAVTLASVLLACSHLGVLQLGRSIHGYIQRREVELDTVAYTALLDMYAKCGSIQTASKVFDQMPTRNVFTWSAMIGGLGIHGAVSRALDLFDQMKSKNMLPNSVTFVSLLSSCSHSGKVKEGREYFSSMTRDYGITATNEHYSCMVDLLGRAGFIEEAVVLIEQMPMQPAPTVWGALLGACRIHQRLELAEQVANKIFVLERDLAGTHVLLSNIYGASEKWDMAKKTREVMNQRGLQKKLAFSSIEIDKSVYIFSAMDGSRCSDPRIAEVLAVVRFQLEELGYVLKR
ncbi:hypothetical protein HPP92_002991 [Vanilla planifolia]|uniref:Pentatricopeptide repeat-containing protein n=1 Tax=Vanilla planifolia TaxID=51239 RepID=A0A835S7A8_VANPL|nr:hypothetical protein HPP92_002991 [Vanilla planifolia]